MKPWKTVDEAKARGAKFTLKQREDEFLLLVDGKVLMSSREHGSEESMIAAAHEGIRRRASPEVMIGGLGCGFTLRAALDAIPKSGKVTVVELVPEIVKWNQGPLAALAGNPLADKRVTVEIADVGTFAKKQQDRFDAILLDVDNGPFGIGPEGNQGLYGDSGIGKFVRAIRPGGSLVVWSAGPDERYLMRLQDAGLKAEMKMVPGKGQRGQHVLFVGMRGRGPARAPAAPRPRR